MTLEAEMPPLDYRIYYRNWHDGSQGHFNAMSRHYEQKLRPIIGHLPRSSARIMEIGAGGGFSIGGARLLGFEHAFGCDADAGQAEDATKCGAPVRHVPLDGFAAYMAEVVAEGRIDAILMFDVLEHVPLDRQRGLLATLATALKPGGMLVCQVPNANSIVSGRYRYGDWTHTTSFTEHSLQFVLLNSGYAQVEVSETDLRERPRLDRDILRAMPIFLLHRLFRNLRRLAFFLEGGWPFAAAPQTPNIIAIARTAEAPRP